MSSKTTSDPATNDARRAQATARRQRRLQDEQRRSETDQAKNKPAAVAPDKKAAVQAGARRAPDQLPKQTLSKPGSEADLAVRPQFLAPDYVGSGKLRDKVAIVTGGDSGIGRAVAVLFAREGADVAVLYLNEHDDARETQTAIEAEGRRCMLISGDVGDPGFCRRSVKRVVEAFGALHVLVNNAAFQQHAEAIEELSDERFDETLRTNVYGYFYMARAAVPYMHAGAAIINTGSVTGLEGSAHLLDYATSKGAIHAFTKSLARNLLPRAIRVNAVAPGPVWTPLNPADKSPEQVAAFGRKTDMHRAAQPEELSPAYVFLAAPVCSGYITGIVLPVTGSVAAI